MKVGLTGAEMYLRIATEKTRLDLRDTKRKIWVGPDNLHALGNNLKRDLSWNEAEDVHIQLYNNINKIIIKLERKSKNDKNWW